MKIYTVTGHTIDFANELYSLFEPEVYTSAEAAEEAAQEMVDDEMSRYDDIEIEVTKTCEDVGSNGYDHDFTISDHDGRLFEVKVRMLEI